MKTRFGTYARSAGGPGARECHSDAGNTQPDLCHSLEPNDRDYCWIREVRGALDSMRPRRDFELLDCEREPGPNGFVALAFADASMRANVRATDPVAGGFAALRDGAGLRIFPRLRRERGGGGCVVFAEPGSGLAQDGCSTADAVELCLSKITFATSVETLRYASRIPIANVNALLRPRALRASRGAILARWAAESDFTVYGIYIAIVTYARAAQSLADRLQLELAAAELLQSLDRADPGARLDETSTVGGETTFGS
jgi:hypothetical protein